MTAKADLHSTSLMLVLSFGTGILDAATYLGLHGVFTANMTGNVVFVGLGLADGDSVPLLRAALALGGFALGASVVGLVQRGRAVASPDHDRVAAGTFLLTGLVVAATAWGLWALPDPSTLLLDLVTAALAFAMGAQAVAARRIAVSDVSTVVVTSTLAGLVAEAPWSGGTASGRSTLRRFSAVATMGAGAVAGAFLLRLGIA
ncbi:MAG: YoaK family protein, partial [Nocardioides sp.]